MGSSQQDLWKKAAAEAAASLVEDGMVLGLGSGTTAALFVTALGARVSGHGLRVSGIPTSEQTAELARSLNIPLVTFAEHIQIDLTVDGADEVEPNTLFLVKGHGGALLREKIVAAASKRMVVIADETKLVEHLGKHPVPVEVVQFGWQSTENRLKRLGAKTSLRMAGGNKPLVTDNGNYIIDCASPRPRGGRGRARTFSGICDAGAGRRTRRSKDSTARGRRQVAAGNSASRYELPGPCVFNF